jgi:hypothetical protein
VELVVFGTNGGKEIASFVLPINIFIRWIKDNG